MAIRTVNQRGSAVARSAERETFHAVNPTDLAIDLSCPGFVNWCGTRAQLEAEGLAPPDGGGWPTGFQSRCWTTEGFRYRLTRCKPPGAKGPRRDFLEIDCWGVFRMPEFGMSYADAMVLESRRQLEQAIFNASPAALDQNIALGRAKRDAQFQAMLAKLAPSRARAVRSLK